MALNLASLFRPSDSRGSVANRQILLSAISKVFTVLSTLIIVPLTIDYVNPEQYGIWLTLTSVVGWMLFLDFGLGNGFRNRFAEARARGEDSLAAQYVSTTYFSIAAIFFLVFIIISIINCFIDWSALLKVDSGLKDELRNVFSILILFFCVSMVANLVSTLLTADQKPGVASLIGAAGQVFSLISIFLLTRLTEGSLTNLAIYFAGIPCITAILASIYVFLFTGFRKFAPTIRQFRFSLIKDILGLGVKFFIIHISLILVFQLMSLVLSREVGSESVTTFNIASKYFNIIYGLVIVVVTPFWTAFTDAYTKHEFGWMKTTLRKLEIVGLLSAAAIFAMLVFSPVAYKIWIGSSVTIPFTLSLAVAVFILLQCLSTIYTYLVAGIGTIVLQMIVYLSMALISWPALTLSCRHFGVWGIVILPGFTYLLQVIIARIQLSKIISGKATGIWNK